MMTRLLVGVVALGVTAALAGEPLPPTAETMRELQKIEAAGFHGGAVDDLRLKYTEAARQRPNDPMPRVFVAWCTMPSDDAWNQLKAISTIYPDNPWVRYGMGRIYTGWKGMGELAKKEFAAVLERDPKFFPALVGQGDLARNKDDLQTAEAKYRAALALADDPFAHAGLGLTLAAAKKSAEALAELKKAIAMMPEQPKALDALIELSKATKDPDTVNAAAALAELRPKDHDARKTLADLRFDKGDKAGAAKDYERLLRLGNPELPVVQRLAAIYRDLKDDENEERTLQTLAALEPSKADANLRLAELKLAKGDSEGAEAQWLEVIARDPKSVTAWERLAKLKLDQKKLNEALEAYRAALKLEGSRDDLKTAADELEAQFKLPRRTYAGSFNHVFYAVQASLSKLYDERKAAAPGLAGVYKARVRVTKEGVAGVDMLEDSVNDPVLLGHLYFTLKDAEYPKQKAEPIYEFVLGKPKKGK